MKRFLTTTLLSFLVVAAQATVTVSQSFDKYSKSAAIDTSTVKVPDAARGFLDTSSAKAWLSASVGKNGGAAYALRVAYLGDHGWAFFSSARDSDGNPLEFALVDRSAIGGDSVSEEFLVFMSREYLAAHKDSGLDVKFYGKGRDLVVPMPAENVQAILSAGAVQGELMALPAAASSTSTSAPKVKIGVQYIPVLPSIATAMGQATPAGVIVSTVSPGSVAAAAGLKQGDVILSVGGRAIDASTNGLRDQLVGIEPGQAVDAQIWRAGATSTVQLRF